MATRDTYTKVHDDWKDRPDKSTAVYATDLEHIEQGIKDAADKRALKEIYDDDHIKLILPKAESATASSYTNIVNIRYAASESEEESKIHTLDREGNAFFAGDVKNGDGVSLNSLKAAIERIDQNILGGAS